MSSRDEDKTGFPWQVTVSQAPVIILAGIYSFGFIALNAHLGKYGVYEFSLANPRYLIVGFLFAVFLLVWYLLPGRAIFFAQESIDRKIRDIADVDLKPTWCFIVVINGWTDIAFFICLASHLLSILFGALSIVFFFVISIFFVISYIWDNINLEKGYPRFDIITHFIRNIVVIFVFVKTNDLFSPTYILALQMILISMFANIVVQSYEKYQLTIERTTYNVLFSIVTALLSSAFFGGLVYENIKPAWGGGQLQAVEIKVYDEVVKGINDMGFEAESHLQADLLHENAQELFVVFEDRTIRLPKTKVVIIKMPERSNVLVDGRDTPQAQGAVQFPD